MIFDYEPVAPADRDTRAPILFSVNQEQQEQKQKISTESHAWIKVHFHHSKMRINLSVQMKQVKI